MCKYRLTMFGLAAVMLTSVSAVSEAADAPRGPAYRPPPPPLFYNWTGLYVGVHAGGGWADLGFGDTGSGFIGGGQVGYNYQINQWVFGLEADVSGSGIKNNLVSLGSLFTASLNWNAFWTVTPRLGYAFDNWLVYGKGGGAWADVSVTGTVLGTPFNAGGGTASGSSSSTSPSRPRGRSPTGCSTAGRPRPFASTGSSGRDGAG